MGQTREYIVSSTASRWEVGLIICVTLAVRSLVVVLQFDNLALDPDAYWQIANGISHDGTYGLWNDSNPTVPTAYRPPLYPLLLSPFVAIDDYAKWGIGILHVVLGTATVLFSWLLARKWGLGKGRFVVLFLVAFDPLLLNQSTLIMTETLAAFMVSLTLVGLTLSFPASKADSDNSRSTRSPGAEVSWKWLLATAIFMGLSVLCRPTFLVWNGLLILSLLLPLRRSIGLRFAKPKRRAGLRKRITIVSTLSLGILFVMGPWVVRNQLLYYPTDTWKVWKSKPILATTHGGYTLLLGNNHSFYEHLENRGDRVIWEAESEEFSKLILANKQFAYERVTGEQLEGSQFSQAAVHDLSLSQQLAYERALDERHYESAKSAIRNDPASFCHAMFVRVGRLWTPIYHARGDNESWRANLLRFAIGSWYSIVLIAVVCNVFRFRSLFTEPWIWGILLAFSLTLIHAFFWSDFRMRAPMIAVLALLAVRGVFAAWECLTGWFGRSRELPSRS